MKYTRLLLLMATLWLAAGVAQAGLFTHPLANASFEEPVYSTFGRFTTGWANEVLTNNFVQSEASASSMPPTPYGTQWGGLNGLGAIYQQVGTWDAATNYTVKLLAGDRSNKTWAGLVVELWAGGTPLGEGNDAFTLTGSTLASRGATLIGSFPIADPSGGVTAGNWTSEQSFQFNTGTGFTVGDPLWLRIAGTAGSIAPQGLVDNVRIQPGPIYSSDFAGLAALSADGTYYPATQTIIANMTVGTWYKSAQNVYMCSNDTTAAVSALPPAGTSGNAALRVGARWNDGAYAHILLNQSFVTNNDYTIAFATRIAQADGTAGTAAEAAAANGYLRLDVGYANASGTYTVLKTWLDAKVSALAWKTNVLCLVGGTYDADAGGRPVYLRFTHYAANTTPPDYYAWIDNLAVTATSRELIDQPVYFSETGDNANDGTNPAAPWNDLNALNQCMLGPGAQLLFKRGETFPGAATLVGSGSAAKPILVSTYGSGSKPMLTGDGEAADHIFLLDSGNEYFDFSNLDLTLSSTSAVPRIAIQVYIPNGSGDLRHFHFQNLDFHDIAAAGTNQSNAINIDALHTYEPTNTFHDVLVDGCTFSNINGRACFFRKYTAATSPATNFVFQNNYATGCSNGLLMWWGMDGALVQFNTCENVAKGSPLWPFGSDNSLVQFNVYKHCYQDTADCFVCHFDYNCKNTIMQYNYGYDVEGGLIEMLLDTNTNADWYQLNAIARYNFGIDCGWRNSVNNGSGIFLNGAIEGCQIYNNTMVFLNQPQYKAISINNWGGGWPTNCSIYNNIFYAAGTRPTYYNINVMSNYHNVVSHNLYSGNIAPPATELHAITNNPMFLNPAGFTAQDFKVMLGSAAISNGVVIPENGGLDFFGFPVSSNTPPTIGAHEYPSDSVIDSDGDKMPDRWESGYGLNPGNPADATGDADSDALKNLAEFALGGNPTNSADTGHAPAARGIGNADGTNYLLYVYPRRADWQQMGLNYNPQVTTNLLTGPWSTPPYHISGVEENAFGAGLDAVTNQLMFDQSASEQFIRLEIH